jgi:malonyl-CoA decarboxylase
MRPRALTQAPAAVLDGIRGRLRDRRLPSLSLERGYRDELEGRELARVRREMLECLEARGGEVSARARADELGNLYLSLPIEGRKRFVGLIASELGVDQEAVVEAARRVAEEQDPGERENAIRALRSSLAAPWDQLLRQFNAVPAGTKFLVDLRADLLRFRQEDETLAPLEHDLRNLLTSWFHIGFLELRRITWDSPASLLEKLAEAEAVHAVSSWEDLKNRLDTDRRVFAFFHPRMPDEPIIFVEVALVSGLAMAIEPLLDLHSPPLDPGRADAAIFYSISNAQPGLAGISFGGFLIKKVVDELSAELRRIKTFATLSPVPGFRAWLDDRLADGAELLLPPERQHLAEVTGTDETHAPFAAAVASSEFPSRPQLAAALKAPLVRLCAEYLLTAKRPDGRALDRVANFHLSNGARVERINWLADTSVGGMRDAAGMMVNYLYSLAHIDGNHEAYAGQNFIAASSAVTRLAREGKS